MTRLDNFLKFYVTNYLSKVAKIVGDFWGILKTSLLSKNCRGYFLSTFEKWATFLIHHLVTLRVTVYIYLTYLTQIEFFLFLSFRFFQRGISSRVRQDVEGGATEGRNHRRHGQGEEELTQNFYQ